MSKTHYTVSQLASLSATSVRTLHHYDELGLLSPAFVGENGYRYYGQTELLRLQQILLLKELNIPLKDIPPLLAQAETDRVGALRAQREKLAAEAQRYRQLVATIDRTIAALTSGEDMQNHAHLYQGFDPAKQAAFETEIAHKYGQDKVDASRAWMAQIGAAGQAKAMAELAEIEGGIADCLARGLAADAEATRPLIARHRVWVASMWNRACPPQAYLGLADIYEYSPDFAARFEAIAPGMTAYLCAAMRAHAQV